ncbi:MAG TPA: ATPase, T2SS/T4P/T4SS family [Polyangium sp.]|nr:ATPase, T2SS/T4P/T4SS family [Polyangium sp.]
MAHIDRRGPSGMIFSVIISEKGGAERRESFERTEVNVGRVQGNDLMLPKGNVSKRHARLLYRDGRFIVTDLKSTNGTYVNGRKITQATIVREGDKIYVGDFVLRIETGAADAKQELKSLTTDAEGAPPSAPGEQSLPGEQKGDEEVPSERDPEVSSAGAVVPGPPRLPSTSIKPGQPLQGPPTITPHPVTTPTPTQHMVTSPNKRTNSSVPPHTNLTPTPPPPRGVRISSNPPGARDSSPSGTRAYRTIVAQLIERAGESFDFDQLFTAEASDAGLSARLSSVLQEIAALMKTSGQIPDSIPVEQLVADAKREVSELGPLGPLGPMLVDEDVTEIYVESAERVLAFRKSRRTPTIILRVNEKTVARALERLSKEKDAEPLVLTNPTYERRTTSGLYMVASSPLRRARGSVVVLRKQQRSENAVLEELVRNGMLSQAMATYLSYIVAVRANVLVVGGAGSAYGSLVSALVNAAPADERILVLQDDEPLTVQHPNALSLPLPPGAGDSASKAKTVAHMHPDRLVCSNLGPSTIDLATAQSESGGCLLASMRSLTLRDVLGRLPADLARMYPGMSLDAAREGVASSFHVLIEVARMGDGRSRVLRIAEPRVDSAMLTARDIFSFNIDRPTATGPVEGSHQPTGIVPVIVEDLAMRGIILDSQLFRRQGK